ncbi:flagellar hook-basal body complex protein FliE [Microvirga terricola]|uniref:Flagellar hook-basal body complex protein FliE n=1 Tax=Microvirga terricola TaxID=2719797 RepID=A0ABX0V5E8_9HYPH|nr:flagellar hook-basal body complex protein FliE [Microvirga terricola]NIX75014.1 flagellar hook-basal body complex protein FliE [Microvirga terricola]
MIESVSALSSVIDRSGSISGVQAAGMQKVAPVASLRQAIDFGDVMLQVASRATETLKAGEAAAISGIQGRASVQQVVEAVMSAEQALQTAISIRDKVVAAYQEISRMAI